MCIAICYCKHYIGTVASDNFYHAIANATGIVRRSVTEEQQTSVQMSGEESQKSSNCTVIMSNSEEEVKHTLGF